jgi:hypothetical protein
MSKLTRMLGTFVDAFSVPLHMSSPAPWAGHTPFAMWLVGVLSPRLFVELGAYSGISYLAFCQNIRARDLPTRCVAVDTWQGDEHAGFYGDTIYEELKSNHDVLYGHFSSLLRKRFEDAVDDFADLSIDLLHIDGLHTYEAVRHDFETWLPKLSPRAVVLFHDTAVRDSDFGVFRFWDEVTQHYPGFSFDHSHGLGVLFVGGESAALWESRGLPISDSDGVSQLKMFFSAVGAAQERRVELMAQTHELVEFKAQHAQLKSSSDQQYEWILKLDRDILALDFQINAFNKNPLIHTVKRSFRQILQRFRSARS